MTPAALWLLGGGLAAAAVLAWPATTKIPIVLFPFLGAPAGTLVRSQQYRRCNAQVTLTGQQIASKLPSVASIVPQQAILAGGPIAAWVVAGYETIRGIFVELSKRRLTILGGSYVQFWNVPIDAGGINLKVVVVADYPPLSGNNFGADVARWTFRADGLTDTGWVELREHDHTSSSRGSYLADGGDPRKAQPPVVDMWTDLGVQWQASVPRRSAAPPC